MADKPKQQADLKLAYKPYGRSFAPSLLIGQSQRTGFLFSVDRPAGSQQRLRMPMLGWWVMGLRRLPRPIRAPALKDWLRRSF